jgi:hypothetical protein
MIRLVGSVLSFGVSWGAFAAPPALEPLWLLEGLSAPESVVPSANGRELYVSNVVGEGDARDGNGFISRVSRDGELLEREWITGLDGPKGLVLSGGTLYATDIVRIVAIDVASGEVRTRQDVPGAKFLNDAALAPDGSVLASDSGMSRISRLRGGSVDTWLEDARLRSVNGLMPHGDRLLVTTMQGLLLSVDWTSKEITVVAEGLGNADGVVVLDDGSYFVGEWPGRLFHVAVDGTSTTIVDTRAAQRYWNDFLKSGDLLIAPHWQPGALSAQRIVRGPPPSN